MQGQAGGYRFIANRTHIRRKLRMHLAHPRKMGEDFGAAVNLQIVRRTIAFMAAHDRRECGQVNPAVHQFGRANNAV